MCAEKTTDRAKSAQALIWKSLSKRTHCHTIKSSAQCYFEPDEDPAQLTKCSFLNENLIVDSSLALLATALMCLARGLGPQQKTGILHSISRTARSRATSSCRKLTSDFGPQHALPAREVVSSRLLNLLTQRSEDSRKVGAAEVCA